MRFTNPAFETMSAAAIATEQAQLEPLQRAHMKALFEQGTVTRAVGRSVHGGFRRAKPRITEGTLVYPQRVPYWNVGLNELSDMLDELDIAGAEDRAEAFTALADTKLPSYLYRLRRVEPFTDGSSVESHPIGAELSVRVAAIMGTGVLYNFTGMLPEDISLMHRQFTELRDFAATHHLQSVDPVTLAVGRGVMLLS